MKTALQITESHAATFAHLATVHEQAGRATIAFLYRKHARRLRATATALREQISASSLSPVVGPAVSEQSGAAGFGDPTDPPCGSPCMFATYVQEIIP